MSNITEHQFSVNNPEGVNAGSKARAARLDTEPRSHLPTDEAALHLGRKPQTLRRWAAFETGPIRPVRVSSRLMWSVASIRALLEGGAQ